VSQGSDSTCSVGAVGWLVGVATWRTGSSSHTALRRSSGTWDPLPMRSVCHPMRHGPPPQETSTARHGTSPYVQCAKDGTLRDTGAHAKRHALAPQRQDLRTEGTRTRPPADNHVSFCDRGHHPMRQGAMGAWPGGRSPHGSRDENAREESRQGAKPPRRRAPAVAVRWRRPSVRPTLSRSPPISLGGLAPWRLSLSRLQASTGTTRSPQGSSIRSPCTSRSTPRSPRQ
jgi:hypothetical protein